MQIVQILSGPFLGRWRTSLLTWRYCPGPAPRDFLIRLVDSTLCRGTLIRNGVPHRWTFNFLIAVGFGNFVGAGVFGFLLNLPIVSYFEVGTMLTSNHGHTAMMGVFGMLAVALTIFALRQVSTDEQWVLPEKFIRVSFWGSNCGLAIMVIASLFPGGVLQFIDVLNNGYGTLILRTKP